MPTRTAVVVAALGLCLAIAAPQSAAAEPALGESKWSLEIGTWLGSGETDATLAIRRHMGASTAWRLGVDAELNQQDGDGTHTATGSPDLKVTDLYESHRVAFTIQWMRFAQIRDNLTATLALGPVISNYHYVNRYDSSFFGNEVDQYESRQLSTAYGLDLGLGAEWFFSRRFALGAQVGLRALVGTSTSTDISRQDVGGPTYSRSETEVESDTKALETSAGKILLTAYF